MLCYFLFVMALLCSSTDSLHLPKRKFIANKKNPSSDLYKINRGQASFISKNWLASILEYKPSIAFEDEHIVRQINLLETHLQLHMVQEDVFLAWMPKGDVEAVLVVVVAELDASKEIFKVKLLVQSPLWCADQIKSTALKVSLENVAKKNEVEIDLEDLYQVDPRYKLEWNKYF